jgi:hypothetical protein
LVKNYHLSILFIKFVDVCTLSCIMFSIILVYNGYAIGYGLPDG